jgi:hypothetical protein
MAAYQRRVERDTLTMMIPFENLWRKTQKRVSDLEEKASEHSKLVKTLEKQVEQLCLHSEAQMCFFTANTMIDMDKLVFGDGST